MTGLRDTYRPLGNMPPRPLIVLDHFHVKSYLNEAVNTVRNEELKKANNKIKRLKRMAYGYRDVKYFLLKIHQHCGLLNPRLQT